MANFKLKLFSSTPVTLEHRAVILVGSAGSYKIYAGDSSNSPVQVTPTLPIAQVESVSIDDTDSPYAVTTNARRNVVLVDATNGATNLNLSPLADWEDQYITIKKVDSIANDVTITPDGSEEIEGSTSIILSGQWNYRTLFSDGNQIVIVSSS